MTGPRKRTATQDAILRQVANAAADERLARVRAEAEARALVESRMQEARDRTNALMYQAHYEHNITKVAITHEGLGTTNRQAADERIRDYMVRAGLTEAETIVLQNEAPPTGPVGIKVELRDESFAVILTDFTHEDVGANLTGEVRFTPSGTLIDIVDANEALTRESANPLWTLRLLDLDPVREATA